MNTYVNSVQIYARGDDIAASATITVNAGGTADVDLSYQPIRSVDALANRKAAVAGCVAAGLVRWATVGPYGGEDSVLVATVALMDQLEPLFAVTIDAPGEEE